VLAQGFDFYHETNKFATLSSVNRIDR